MKRIVSAALLAVPYAAGYLVGLVVLCAVVVWLALCDGYARGRGKL